ncbi:MAG: rhamnan synthesis F family protein [Verrucomicrobiota bacterium]
MSELTERVRIYYLSLILLSAEQRRRVKIIALSGKFDEDFYRSNHRLNWLARLFPIRHYVVRGEKRGLSPNRGFDPRVYAWKYQREIGRESALCHHLEHGRKQGFDCSLPKCELLPPKIEKFPPSSKRAVVLHLYYHDLWDEFESSLRELEGDYELICTIVAEQNDDFNETAKKILQFKRNARCFEFPNHGRDIFPFVHLINQGILDDYELIAKVHSKKSPHRKDGEVWRRDLVAGVLPKQAEQTWVTFLESETASCAVAPGQIEKDSQLGWPNRNRTSELARRIGLAIEDLPLEYPAGSMYLVKPEIISSLKELSLEMDDFEVECGQIDGTTAHAVERLVGYLCHGRLVTTDLLNSPITKK